MKCEALGQNPCYRFFHIPGIYQTWLNWLARMKFLLVKEGILSLIYNLYSSVPFTAFWKIKSVFFRGWLDQNNTSLCLKNRSGRCLGMQVVMGWCWSIQEHMLLRNGWLQWVFHHFFKSLTGSFIRSCELDGEETFIAKILTYLGVKGKTCGRKSCKLWVL